MDAEALVGRVEELTAQLDTIGDPFAQSCAEELVGALMQLYGEGLERIFEAVDEAGTPALRERLVDDGVVASLMLIHGLYPVPLEARVREALDSVRPYMETHGGDVELLRIVDDVAYLRLEGHCRGCAASASTLELGIKQALAEAAPDLQGIEVEGVMEPAQHGPPGAPPLVELPIVHANGNGNGRAAAPPPRGWLTVPGLDRLGPGAIADVSIDDVELMVANVDGDLLAYRNACAACGARLDDGRLEGATLSCAACSHSFELRLAGRSTEGTGLQLAPVPLLREGGDVRVAVAA
jgi:Fe-S cluster biogenesis protein NfuA/nitrite reductase/ring-hydroxylating ferredoxin subunit